MENLEADINKFIDRYTFGEKNLQWRFMRNVAEKILETAKMLTPEELKRFVETESASLAGRIKSNDGIEFDDVRQRFIMNGGLAVYKEADRLLTA